MAYQIQVVEDSGILELRFQGRGDFQEHAAARDDAFGQCQKHGISRLLVDLRAAVTDMAAREIFAFGTSLESARLLHNIRIAAVMQEDDTAADMIVAVAQTRNIEIRVFLTEEAARSWLMT